MIEMHTNRGILYKKGWGGKNMQDIGFHNSTGSDMNEETNWKVVMKSQLNWRREGIIGHIWAERKQQQMGQFSPTESLRRNVHLALPVKGIRWIRCSRIWTALNPESSSQQDMKPTKMKGCLPTYYSNRVSTKIKQGKHKKATKRQETTLNLATPNWIEQSFPYGGHGKNSTRWGRAADSFNLLHLRS